MICLIRNWGLGGINLPIFCTGKAVIERLGMGKTAPGKKNLENLDLNNGI